MSPQRVLTAREAYSDCLEFVDTAFQTRTPAPESAEFSSIPDIDPQGGFEIRVTATHAVLMTLVTRYPAADFEFHSERNPIPGTTQRARTRDPLNTHIAEFTVDFTPYGTIFGGSSNDGGGNAPQSTHRDDDTNRNYSGPSADRQTPQSPPTPDTPGTPDPTGQAPSPLA